MKVKEAPAADKDRVLDLECAADEALREEVQSLLEQDAHPSEWPSINLQVADSRPALRCRPLCLVGTFCILLLLVLTGEYMRIKIRNKIEKDLTEQLVEGMIARHTAIEIWVQHRLNELKKLALDPLVRSSVQQLVQLSIQYQEHEMLMEAPEQKVLHQILMRALETSNYRHYSVWNMSYRILATDIQKYIGRHVKPELEAIEALTRLRLGQGVILPRRRFGSGIGVQPMAHPEDHSAFGVPVLDDERQPIGALIFNLPADAHLDRIMSLGRWKTTGDMYAFNALGILLSETRFKDQLSSLGLIEHHETSVLKLKLRDPGGNLLEGEATFGDKESWPMTRPVSLGIAAARSDLTEVQTGIILKPYRDYRGVETVGAWLWDPKLNFGLVREMAADEAMFTMHAVNTGVRVIYGLALVGVIMVGLLFMQGRTSTLGPRLGPYRLLHRIGAGGLGDVFLAKHELLKRPTAIKLLRADVQDQESIARFEREVKATSLLSHPNTITIFDYGRSADGRFYYAMEYLSGISLAQLLTIESRLPMNRTVYLLKQIVASLREAHRAGMVHRDIKPLNIMVCRVGGEYDVIKVLDFGLVKLIRTEGFSEVTLHSSRGLYGTPLYMAPECLQSNLSCDGRADIYSLGVVAYKLLSGQNPFTSTNDLALMYDVLFTQPTHLQQLQPELDDDLAALVMSCLAKSVEQRPASMDEVMNRLDQLKISEPWSGQDARTWWERQAELPQDRNGHLTTSCWEA